MYFIFVMEFPRDRAFSIYLSKIFDIDGCHLQRLIVMQVTLSFIHQSTQAVLLVKTTHMTGRKTRAL